MKKLPILISIVFFAAVPVKGQSNIASERLAFQSAMNSGFFRDTSSTLKEEYLRRSKSQRTIGWVLLGGGVAMGTAGVIIFSNTDDFLSSDSPDTGGVLILLGLGSALGSIPLFISSGHNARKAAMISFKNQELAVPGLPHITAKSQPAVSFKISL